MILFKVITWLGAALFFVLTSGVWFQAKFRNHRFLVLLAGAVAIISTYFLIEQVWERFGDQIKANWHTGWEWTASGWKKFISDLAPVPEHPPPGSSPKSVSFRDCKVCPQMVTVEAGSFMMGSSRDEPGHDQTESPVHEVKISKPFVIGRFKVSFDEWDACVAEGGCNGYKPDDAGWGRGTRPVIGVSWEDAHAYTEWLTRKTSKLYRLPSEAEWEYAARAGTTGPFSLEGKISSDKANYLATETYDGSAPGLSRERTVPVTMFKPNAFGLYQVHGNVWEWVEDCWAKTYADTPRNGAPNRHGDCESHVIRSGSWSDPPHMLRSARRGFGLAGSKNNRRGFRVAREL
jgi:formylglycine-generating enzyme required for sulfatase activity